MVQNKYDLKQNVKKQGSWGDSLGIVFKLISFIHKYRIFRPWLWFPNGLLNWWGTLFGHIFLNNKKTTSKLQYSIQALLHSNSNPKLVKKIIQANNHYMGQILLDAMFNSPNINFRHLSKFIEFKNLHYLKDSLKKGHGVILLSLHMGMFFHSIAGMTYRPEKYEIFTIIQESNKVMYENIVNRSEIPNLHTIPSSQFEIRKLEIIQSLKNNGILITLYDYSKLSQFRVPFWENHFPYLITTPQSAISLHKETGATIIPLILHPKGEIGKSVLEFLDPAPISRISSQFYHSSEKVFHGELSIAINAIFAPYIIKYLHIWEELPNFFLRIGDNFESFNSLSLSDFIRSAFIKCHDIIDSSYESGRPDEKIKIFLQSIETKIQKELVNSLLSPSNRTKLVVLPIKIDLSEKNGIAELDQMLKLLHRVISNSVPNLEALKLLNLSYLHEDLKNEREFLKGLEIAS